MKKIFYGNRGTGKSVSLAKEARTAIAYGKKVLVICPNGCIESEKYVFGNILSKEELDQIIFTTPSIFIQSRLDTMFLTNEYVLLVDESSIVFAQLLHMPCINNIVVSMGTDDTEMTHLFRDDRGRFVSETEIAEVYKR